MNTRQKIIKYLQWSVLSAAALSMVACKSEDFILDAISTDDDVVCTEDTTDVDFKQIAYWAENEDETLEDIDFSKLTHIIYDKIGVSSDGSLIISDDLEDELNDLVDAVDDSGEGTLILFSIGNDSDTAFSAIASSTSALANFNDEIQDLFDDYDIDGIDINWQFPSEDDEDDFETLIESVEETVHDDNDKLLTFVVDKGDDDSLTDSISDDALDAADFINILTVENSSNDDDGDNLEEAEDSITYWTDERCIVKNKLVVAIPAQGISTDDESKSFADIFDHKNSDACLDRTASRTYYYYNGIPTATDKTEYAQSNAGGVVLTSLQNDIFDSADIDDYSLLTTIDSQVNGTPNTICD
jgi:hypothetical protein